MINETMYGLGSAPSAIRELFAYGLQRKAEIGEDKVFDFSIGNPNVPAPAKVAKVMHELADMPPAELHAYSPSSGWDDAKAAIADNLNRRFGTDYAAKNLYLTMGAAACLSCCIKAAIIDPGDEIIVISPYFPEYRVWIEADGGKCVEVPARTDNFQIDLDAVAAAINERTRAVIINSPNNPVGVVYTRETLEGLAKVLHEKREEFGSSLYLISDEPYRELAYGPEVSWVPSIYDNTLVCYSWSKSLSLPGDRIGYVLVPNEVEESERVMAAISGAGRALGYICAPVFFQRVIANASTSRQTLQPMPQTASCLPRALMSWAITILLPMERSTCGCRRLNLMLRHSPTRQRNTSFCWFPPTASALAVGCA